MKSPERRPRSASLPVFDDTLDAEDNSESEDSDQLVEDYGVYGHDGPRPLVRPDYYEVSVLLCVLVGFSVCFFVLINAAVQHSDYQAGATYRYRRNVNATLGYEKKPNRILVCTLSTVAMQYPRDGLCDVIVLTHVLYDSQTGSLHPHRASDNGLSTFLRHARFMTRTRLLPSHDWIALVKAIDARYARGLYRALELLKLKGLALFNVHVSVEQLPGLIDALRLLHKEDPRMFLALGAMFEGISDEKASGFLPSDLFDQLVTPLRLFVLETHLPVPSQHCYTGLSAPLDSYGNTRQTFTLKGAESLLAHRALAYVNTTVLVRCISALSGALVFDVPLQSPEPGAPCLGWSTRKLSEVCRVPTIRHHMDAQSAYGHTDSTFFSFDSTKNMMEKVGAVLQRVLDTDSPACLAVYGLDLDDMRFSCPRMFERSALLVYTARDVLSSLKERKLGAAK
ncbi:unnamed protein product [Ixodes hexagonus]